MNNLNWNYYLKSVIAVGDIQRERTWVSSSYLCSKTVTPEDNSHNTAYLSERCSKITFINEQMFSGVQQMIPQNRPITLITKTILKKVICLFDITTARLPFQISFLPQINFSWKIFQGLHVWKMRESADMRQLHKSRLSKS